MIKVGVVLGILMMTTIYLPMVASTANQSNDIYPMFGINPQHNFQSPFSAKDNNGYLKDVKVLHLWGVVMDRDYLYGIGGTDPGYIVKYNINTGERVWDTSHNLGMEWGKNPVLLLFHNTLYLYISCGDYSYTGHINDSTSCNQNVWAISTNDGHVLWKYMALKTLQNYYHKSFLYYCDQGYSTPTIGKDGTVYLSVSGYDNKTGDVYNAIIAVNPNGTTKWIYPLEQHHYWNGLPKGITLDDHDNVYALTNNYLYGIRHNGTLMWKVNVNLKNYYGLSIYGNRIYFIGYANNSTSWKLFAYSTNGKFLWTFKIGKVSNGLSMDYSPTIAPDGDVYITNITWVYSISSNGTLNWKVKAPNVLYLVADKDKYTYFSTGKGIYRLSAGGELKALYELQDYKSREKSLSHLIYIGPNGEIYGIYYEDGGTTYLYIFENDPFAFLKNPIFITAIVLIIAVPAAYFAFRRKRGK